MTDPGNEPDESTSNDAPSQRPSEAAEGQDKNVQPDSTLTAISRAEPEMDELPEEEELTPELVEEEAIRGDFMLRWATIFLAVLFGFSQIGDSRTLVHVRSGQYMQQHGIVPDGNDPFSYALSDQPAANVSWLFDHVTAAVYGLGGETGLTFFKALVAGLIAYLLSLISVRGMPTWWNSVCCLLGIAAASVDFMPVTDLATLLGLSVTLLLLHRHSEGTVSGLTWKLPLLLAVWANFDPRAYLGVIAVALFAVGSRLQAMNAQKSGDYAQGQRSLSGGVVALCLLALLVNPSPVASLLSVVNTYTVEYPTMASMQTLTDPSALLDGRTEYYSLLNADVWQSLEFAWLAGAVLLIITTVVLVLSSNRQDLPWAVMFTGFAVLGIFKLHELPAAALVAAVTAALVAQRWYGRTFRQEYTTDTKEVLFSRGGRAVTVLGMAFLGFCIVADRLPARTPIGLGIDPELAATMQSLEEEFAELPDDARVLNTRMTQGDLLIWHGRQAFVDSRASLFGRIGNPGSVISKFDSLRKSVLPQTQQPDAATGNSASDAATADGMAADGIAPEEKPASSDFNPNWKQEYDALQITHVMLRLAPPGVPAYPMLRTFGQSPDWVLTSRGASAAFFRYEEGAKILSEFDIKTVAFQEASEKEPSESAEEDGEGLTGVERFDYAREPNFYQKYLYERRHSASAALREAQHLLELDLFPQQVVFNVASAFGGDVTKTELIDVLGRALAAPTLAIRRANEALREDPESALGYRVLGTAYVHLNGFEQAIAQAMSGQDASGLRSLQAILAFRQAAVLEPLNSSTWQILSSLYAERGRTGLALDSLNRFLELEETVLLENPDADEQLRQIYSQRTAWEDQLAEMKAQLDAILEEPPLEDPQQQAAKMLQVAGQLVGSGQVQMALNLMKQNSAVLRGNPEADLLLGQLMLEAGEFQKGEELLAQLAEVARSQTDSPQYAGLKWHLPVAVAYVGRAGYDPAISALDDQLRIFEHYETRTPELIRSLVQLLPLVPAVETRIGMPLPAWPIVLLQASNVPMISVPGSRNEPLFHKALLSLEAGDLKAAEDAFLDLIQEGGETVYRPLAAVYLLQFSDSYREVLEGSFLSLWEDFTFPGDAVAEEGAAVEKTDAAKPESNSESSETKPSAADKADADKPAEGDDAVATEAAAKDPAAPVDSSVE